MERYGISIFLFLIFPSAALSQTNDPGPGSGNRRLLTLSEAIARARADHPLLDMAHERILMAEGEELAAGRRHNPTLTISGENFPIEPTVDGFDFSRDPEWTAFISQTFETSGKRRLRQTVAAHNVEVHEADQAILERQVIAEVKGAYERAVAARTRLELMRENFANFQQIVQYNEVRVAEGYTAEGDLIKVRLEAQRVAYGVRQATLELERAKIDLLQAMGSSSYATDFDLQASSGFQPVAASFDELEKLALQRPEILLAQKRLEQAEAELQLERARSKPDIIGSFGFKRNGPDNGLYGAISLPLPFFDRNQGGIGRALAQVRLAQAQLRQARNGVLADLAAAHRAVQSAEAQIEALRRDFLGNADESRAVALAAYREGAGDLLLLLEAQRARAGAQELYVQSLTEYRLAVYDLERAASIERLPFRDSAERKEQSAVLPAPSSLLYALCPMPYLEVIP